MKNNFLLIYIPLLFLIFLFNIGCMTKKKLAKLYIENDSTSFYSTHPSRPFKYGYPISIGQCEEMRNESFKYYDIKKGDVIADVGAASGWLDGAFSVLIDSVTFYVQDVDTHFLNQDQLNRVVKYFSSLRKTPQTNTFHMVIGDKKKTNLPDSTFDKIIINNTFHEMVNPWRIVEDLKRKLKPKGKIIIYDGFSNKYKKNKHEGCGIIADKVSFVSDLFSIYDFYLTNMTMPESSFTNFLTFETDKEKAEAFAIRQKYIKNYMDSLEKLNYKEISNDSLATSQIAFYLKNHLMEIHNIYATLEDYINSLGYVLLKEQEPLSAKNIFQVNITLYPTSFNAYDSFAEA